MSFVYAVVTGILIMFVGKYMTYLFVSGNVEENLWEVWTTHLKCVGIFFIPLAVVNLYRNGIQGMGYGLLPMTAGIAELIGRGVVALAAAGQKSYIGVCMQARWLGYVRRFY